MSELIDKANRSVRIPWGVRIYGERALSRRTSVQSQSHTDFPN